MPSQTVTLYSTPKSLYSILGAVAGLVVLVLLIRGLSTSTSTITKTTGPDRPPEDPWPVAAKALDRETDLGTCRRVLDQLTSDLAASPNFPAPAGLTPDGEKTLRSLFAGFHDDDARELRAASFTRLDPHYLEESYFFRDVARSLDVADLPPVEQAKKAFAFVCRQVYLNRWLVRINPTSVQPQPPVPAAYVLRRGWGTGIERAFAFLALARQLGLDGCLIGPPGAEGKSGLYAPPDKEDKLEALNGPFWAVGVRVGANVYLFEPWRGEPFPGPDPAGVGTLAQHRADPKLLDAWRGNTNVPWEISAAAVQSAEVYLATPLSALAPRMRMLEEKLTGASAVRLAVDAAAVRDGYVKDGATKAPPKWWSPAPSVDPFDVFHGTSTFIPTDDGGRGGPAGRIGQFQESLLPTALFAPATELESNEAQAVLRNGVRNVYRGLFLTPPTPIEKIQRGGYFDVATYLAEKERSFSQGVQRFRGTKELPRDAREFVGQLNGYYGQLQKARATRNAPAEAELKVEIETLWSRPQLTGPLIERSMAEPAEAEASYLLALCKHEAADRASVRAARAQKAVQTAEADPKADPERVKVIRTQASSARAAASSAWKDARTWWHQYQTVQRAQLAEYPGRVDHAGRLAAEAELKAGQ